jgi:glycosidase
MNRDWLREGFVYEVFPRNFSKDGDLAGVTEQLPRLVELGVGVVCLMPIHPIGHLERVGFWGSPYAVQDHRAVCIHLGDMAALRELVGRAHELGLRVIMDFVGHCGSPDGVVARSHPDWVLRDDEGRELRPEPKAPHIDRVLWDEERGEFRREPQGTDVVAFERVHPGLRRYLAETLQFWLREADVDGFRCVDAARLPPDLWVELRSAMDQVKPEAALLAEARACESLGIFDMFYDEGFFEAVRGLYSGKSSASTFWEARESFLRERPPGAARMIFLEHHDQRRVAHVMGAVAQQPPLVLLYCSEGTLMIHNGQEIGCWESACGDLLCERKPISWRLKDSVIIDHHRRLLGLRRRWPALVRGDLLPLESGHPRVVAFERHLCDERILVIVNMSGENAQTQLDRSEFDDECLSIGAPHGFPGATEEGLVMGPWSWLVYAI